MRATEEKGEGQTVKRGSVGLAFGPPRDGEPLEV